MIYLDTSAFLKRYILEAQSDEFDAFFTSQAHLHISRLTFVEARYALSRRKRAKQISTQIETQALNAMRQDVQDGAITLNGVSDEYIARAYHLIEQVKGIPLRTLDALHLAIALGINATAIASADIHQMEAAAHCGLEVFAFN